MPIYGISPILMYMLKTGKIRWALFSLFYHKAIISNF